MLGSLNKEQKGLSALLGIFPGGISIATDVSCKEIRHNPAAAEWLRIQPWDRLSHSDPNPPAVKVMCQGKELLPEEMPIQLAAWQGKDVRDYELEFVWNDGVHKASLWNASPLFDDEGNIAGAVASFKDITEQKRADRRAQHRNAVLAGINRIFQEALTCGTERELGIICLTVAEELTRSQISFISEIDQAGLYYGIAISNPGWDACQIADQTGHRRAPIEFKIHGIYGRVLLDGKPFFTNDPASHPDSVGLPDGHPPVNSFLGVPLIHEGRTIGMIGLGNREGGYCQEDLEAAEDLSPAVVQAFMRKRAEQKIRRLNEELEWRVFERTGELAAANEELAAMNEELINNARMLEGEIERRRESGLALQAANQKITNIVESISDAFIALDREWRFTYVNTEARRQLRLQDEANVISQVFWEAFPNYSEVFYEMCHKAIVEQTPVCFEAYSLISERWYDFHAYPSPDGLCIYYVDVTESKETQAKLEKSQQDISDILNSISDPFIALDKEWRIIYINQECASYIGKPPAELLGQIYLDVVPDLVNSNHYKNYCQTMFERVPVHFEEKGVYKDSWFAFNAYPCQVGIAVYARDITERKRMEQQIADALEFNRAIVDALPLGICTFDSSGQCVFANDAAARMAGGSKEQILQQNFKCLETWQQTGLLDMAQRVLSTGTSEHLQVHHGRNTSGKQAWFEDRLSRCTSGGESHLLVIDDDITERKEAEEALRQSEERFFKAFHASPCAMSITHLSDYWLFDVNQRWLDVTGFSRQETVGKLRKMIDISKEQQRQQAFDLVKEYGSATNLETVIRNKKGEERDILWSGEIITLNGEPCLLGAWIDITERKKYEQEMTRLDRLHLVGEMAAGIGHEIRNPMTVVRGYLQVLEEKEEFASHKKRFNTMIAELDRANSIITEYLSLAKNRAVNLTRQGLNGIVEAMLPLIQAEAIKNYQQVALELGDLPDLLLDGNEIRQVILNLARNGLQAMPPKGVLAVRTCLDGAEVVLAVQNEGPEIPPEVLEKIGTPFFTTKDNGTGLGMAVSYSIAARHKAKIRIETGLTGTTFYVCFPVPTLGDEAE